MRNQDALVLRDNREWLRYVFFAGAVGMCFLLASMLNSPERETGKMIGTFAGILLLGFCGFVLKCQRFEFDALNRQVTIRIRGFRSTSIETLSFGQIRKIVVAKTFESVEDSRGRSEMRERWRIDLLVDERTIPVTTTLYVGKEQALRVADSIQRMLNITIADDSNDAVDDLIKTGRLIEAIAVVRKEKGLSLADARDYVLRRQKKL
jgi:hypothetical protein